MCLNDGAASNTLKAKNHERFFSQFVSVGFVYTVNLINQDTNLSYFNLTQKNNYGLPSGIEKVHDLTFVSSFVRL